MVALLPHQVEHLPQRDRRDQQDVLVAQREEVWALPHPPGLGEIAATELMQVLPVDEVRRPIEEDVAALADDARADDAVPAVGLAPDERVAEALDLQAGRRLGNDRI